MIIENTIRELIQSFFENPLFKLILASFISLFHVEPQFIMAIPIFWMLDFISGLSAAKRRGEPISIDKINSQFIKFIIHIVFLIGCVVIANLFYVDSFLRAGFGYIIATEFLSTTRNLFGKKESVKVIRHFKKLLFEIFGINLDNNENEKED